VTRRRSAVDLAEEIAERAACPIEQVWAYFAFDGRVPTSVQVRISQAEVEVLGLGRDRGTRRKRLNLMTVGDYWLANEADAYLARLGEAA